MAQIKVTPNLLRGQAQQVVGIKDNHNAIVSQITSLVRNLNSQWKGAAQNKFLERYENFARTTFVDFSQMLQDYADLMKTAANELEQQDATLASGTMNSFS